MPDIDDLAFNDETPVVEKSYVERRVDDWFERLRSLFGEIIGWTNQHGWSHAEEAPVAMHEDLMQQAGVPSRDLVGIVLKAPSGDRVWFKPKALWVIGANGRVDVYARSRSLVLIDTAQPFEPPAWLMYDIPSKDGVGRPFSADILPELI